MIAMTRLTSLDLILPGILLILREERKIFLNRPLKNTNLLLEGDLLTRSAMVTHLC